MNNLNYIVHLGRTKATPMLKNELLLASIAAWLIAQLTKTIINAIENKKLDLSRLVGDGGMPSCHSATVCSLATSSALCFGFSSYQFAMAAVFAIVVMHDASGVRLESGKQAKAINEMIEYLQTTKYKTHLERLEELLGHTPIQVLVGALIGILISVITHAVINN